MIHTDIKILSSKQIQNAKNRISSGREYKNAQWLLEHKNVKLPPLKAMVTDPLFNGTLYFVRITFNTPSGAISITNADIQTALNYSQSAIIPISAYALQYGSNSVNVSNNIIQYSVNLTSNTYNNSNLIGWVNDIASTNSLPTGSSCVVVLNPVGITNTDADRAGGIGGFHGKANLPFCFCNVYGQNFTVNDSQNTYAQVLSHEIAEMTVDPLANVVNPEVCDACAGNCGNLWLDFFDNNNQFIDGSQNLPPPFSYNFFINSLVQPAFYNPATECAIPGSNLRAVCVYDYAPRKGGPAESWAVSWGTGRLDVFGAGENNELLHRWFDGSWTGPESLGGTLGSIYPSAVSWGTGRLDVFGVGENRELLHWWFDGTWTGPESLGGTLGNMFPSAVSWGTGRLDVFGAGGNSELLHWWFDVGTWNGPESFDSGMWTNSKPTVVSWGTGRLDVFGVGFNHELLHRWFDGTSWNGPVSRGGNLLFSTSQSAVSSKTGHLDVFGVGGNNELLHWWFDGTWHTESFDSGMWINSKPSVVAGCSGRLDVFGEGENNVLLHRWRDAGGSWNGPESLGGTLLTGAAPAAVSSNAGQIDVFGLGQNHDLLQWTFSGTTNTWTVLAMSLDSGRWRSDVD